MVQIEANVAKKFDSKCANGGKEKIDLDCIEEEVNNMRKYVKELEPQFKDDLMETVQKQLTETCQKLLREYVNELNNLVSEISVSENEFIKLDPATMIQGSINPGKFTVDKLIRTEQIEDGKEWIKNTDRKLYKPWTWFQEKGYWRQKYKDHQFILYKEFYYEFFTAIDYSLWENIEIAEKYVDEQINTIKNKFLDRIGEINERLKGKLNDYEAILKEQEGGKREIDKIIKDIENKREWLSKIKVKVNKILEC